MALPTQKRAKSRKRVKQYQYRLKRKNLSICPECQKPILPHRACSFCGFYAGKEVVKLKITKEKKAKGSKK